MKMLSGESASVSVYQAKVLYNQPGQIEVSIHKASDLHFTILSTISMMTNDYIANPAPISVRTAQSRY